VIFDNQDVRHEYVRYRGATDEGDIF
jgi:hypothetical protein